MNMEHSGTSRNIPEPRIIMRKICKGKILKTEKTGNLEAVNKKCVIIL